MTLPAGPPTPIDVVMSPDPMLRFDRHLLRIIAGGPGRSSQQQVAAYRRFLGSIAVAMYTTDANGRITFFNDAATSFWGRTPALGEEWCGSLRMSTVDGADLPHDQCPMAIALRTGKPVRGAEAVAERPDGTKVSFLAYPTPLHDDRGELLGAVNVLIDTSEQRRMETALRATADALERSNAVKDEFLGLVSHELRTPVTTILGNARLLRDHASTLDDVTKHEMISDIDEEAHRLHSVIENLLTLSRLTSAAELEHEPQLVGPTVSEEVEIFRRRHPDREIRLRSEGSPVIVEADSAHLHLLLVNFLTNADKYSPPGEPIDVVVQRAHGEVSVRVLDRGIGLGEAGAEDLFRPFFRTPSARMQASGVGIGLAVCRRIVEALGGRIWAAPREGGGSEFGFALKVSPDTYR